VTLPEDAAGIMARVVAHGSAVSAVVGRSTARFIAPGSTTDGAFGLFRWDMEPRSGGPSPHIHRTYSESFFVLEGTLRLFDGRGWTRGGPGDVHYVPPSGVHAFENSSDTHASMLILFAPGAPREDYFRELGEMIAAGTELSPEERTAFLARHDQYEV
jgi:quercetin dioxygenase-like cupin family protein